MNEKSRYYTTDDTLKKVFSDIDTWPDSWAGDNYDIPVGHIILKEFKSFLSIQIERNLSKKTLKNYGVYLWALGGEIIRDTSCNDIKAHDLKPGFLLEYVAQSGGSYWRHSNNEQNQSRYDSICRKFYKYLICNSS